MNKRSLLFPVLTVTFFLPFTASANAGWPTLLIAVSPLLTWYIGVISIVIEATILWLWLRPSFGQAFLMAFIANSISLAVGFLIGGLGVGKMGQTSFGESAWIVGLFNSWHVSLLLMFLLTVIVETVVQLSWKYPWKKILTPIVLGNILTYLIIELQYLKDTTSSVLPS